MTKIATWNINGMQARLGFLLHWLQARSPDLVMLQELKLDDERFPHAELNDAGFDAHVHGQKSWNGVAVLVRRGAFGTARATRVGLPGLEEQGARLLGIEIEPEAADGAPDGAAPLTVYSVYVPNGKTVAHEEFQRKLAWLDGLAAHLAGQVDPARSLIVGGDFNLCPGPLDTYDEAATAGRIFHTDQERSRYQAIVDPGLEDLFRGCNPDSRLFSWWDYRAGNFHKNIGLRIDLLLATPPLATRTRSVQIDRDYRKKKDGMIASDHAPVIAEIDL